MSPRTDSEESTFRSLLEAAPDGILFVDRSGKITLANAQCAKLFGWKAEELIGQLVEVLVPEYIRPVHQQLRDGYFAAPRSRPMGIGLDLVGARSDGSLVPVEISLSTFRLQGVDGAIAIVRDATELRRLDRELKRNYQDLKRSNAELEQFAYVASHDLQEPLRMVSGYTQLLKRRYAGKLDQDANEYIEFAVDGVKRMQDLINDLLSYSRLSARSKPFSKVNLADVMSLACANLQASLSECGGAVKYQELPFVYGERAQLNQLFQNLISNSVKFRRDETPPIIEVSATREQDNWRISITDNGIGIDKAYAEKIFVIFQRLHTRDRYPGTGIGLALCKKIVERHGGRIWFDSELGKGTTFHLTLPSQPPSEGDSSIEHR